MPRRRMIDPSIWDDPEVGELTPTEFKLFIGCISMADDEGRLVADPRTLRKQLFGYREGVSVQDVSDWTASVAHKLPNFCLYDVDGKSYIALLKWNTHQTISASWKQVSSIPAPPAEHMPSTCQAHAHQVPSTCPPIESSKAKQSKQREGKQASQSNACGLPDKLKACGVSAKGITSLLAGNTDGWITPERIGACWSAVQERNDVTNPVGLLVTMLRDRDEPPRVLTERDERYKYIEGKYADYIQH